MLFVRSLLLLMALMSSACAQDGPQIASGAKDAAQALQLYLDGVARSGDRPDYTRPPAADLFRRVFDLEHLTTLPSPKSSDLPWVLDWFYAAKESNKLILKFGAKPGPDLDQAALSRNLTEYEDQYASASNFLVRLAAREVSASLLFMDQLTPEQRTPVREAGLQKARGGVAELIGGSIGSLAQGMRPANSRQMTAAIRDTRNVWATFMLPKDRTQIISLVTRVRGMVKDDETNRNLADFAATLAAAAADTGPLEDGRSAYQRGDYRAALRLLRSPAEQGVAEAQSLLGFMYHDGQGVAGDDVQAAVWFRKAAEQGNLAAEAALGVMYFEGRGVAKNDEQAVRWLQQPAEQGLPFAQSALGGLYDKAANYAGALKWYRLAAAQGDAEAQSNLGNMYETGRGVAQNYADSLKYYRLAAGRGLAAAQYNLGILYDNGHGVTRDYAEAAKWYRLAAAQGDADAQYSLGVLYDNGSGVPQDDAEAAKWFRLAADQGYAKAQANLGTLLARGLGAPRDYVEAYMWFELAAAQGNQPARDNRDKAASLMTAAELAEAKQLARDWKPKPQR